MAKKVDVTVELEDIGEGVQGDFNPEDPNDIPLLRFTVLKDGEPVDDGSYCTQIPATVKKAVRKRFENVILHRVRDAVESGASIKKICEVLSWLGGEELTRIGGKEWIRTKR